MSVPIAVCFKLLEHDHVVADDGHQGPQDSREEGVRLGGHVQLPVVLGKLLDVVIHIPCIGQCT